jgi:hypothetical protein
VRKKALSALHRTRHGGGGDGQTGKPFPAMKISFVVYVFRTETMALKKYFF